jgi:quercetin dioxygenase-like cupin family protein
MKDMNDDRAPFRWADTIYVPVITSAETGGVMSMTDCLTPAGSGPPRHVHEGEDETFVVLDDKIDFWMQDRDIVTKGPGEVIFAPRGIPHTFRTRVPSRHLVIMTPGGFERFFREMAEADPVLPRDAALVAGIAARYRGTFTGPPLEAA